MRVKTIWIEDFTDIAALLEEITKPASEAARKTSEATLKTSEEATLGIPIQQPTQHQNII